LTYQSTHENMRARMYSVLDITGQGFGSADACRVPWANETTTATQRNLEADATDRPAWGTPPGRTTRWPESSSGWLEVAVCRP
jgi:hypothetical protein